MNDKSLGELMAEAYSLSLDCAFSEVAPNGSYFTSRNLPISKEKDDLIFAWADGLMHKYYMKNHFPNHDRHETPAKLVSRANQMINFDLEDFENKVIKAIELFKELLNTYGKPIQLNFAEMQKRGYRGKWAGYTKEQDDAFYLQNAKDELTKAEENLKGYLALPKKDQWNEKTYNLNKNISDWRDEVKRLTK